MNGIGPGTDGWCMVAAFAVGGHNLGWVFLKFDGLPAGFIHKQTPVEWSEALFCAQC